MSTDRESALDSLSFPYGALVATTAMQTLATMAAYAVPALAPVVAKDLGVDGALTGYFVSVVYGVGIISSLLAADFIHRHGAVRAGQWVLVSALAMLIISTWGGVGALAAGAVVLGLGYGATAPSSTHLLVPRTPPRILNFVMSLRQIGVPLGGVLAGLLLPPVALLVGWQKAMLLLAAPIVLLLIALEWPRRNWDRRDWDRQRAPQSHSISDGLRRLVVLLKENQEIRALTTASFIYSGVQLCFVALMAVHLTARAGFGIVAAGQTLALYQVCGVVSRPIWGWIADRAVPARWLLVAQGLVMSVAAIVAGQFGADWPGWLVLATCAIAGASASGYTGIAYAEFARLGGARRTESTGLGSAAMFAGVLVIPSLATLLITTTGSYALAYGAVGMAAASAAVLLASRRAAIN
ncbi:MAG: MFS transporter [Burkholderiales bacterium]